jgi:hypothetical protein
MTEKRTYFNRWFRDVVSELTANPDAGFVVLITSLTLLERYLREKSNNDERTRLDDPFFAELIKLIPQIPDIEVAKQFWKVARHGLMHQATFKTRLDSTQTISEIGIDDTVDIIRYENRGHEHSFMVSPTKFAKLTITTIENDFSTFLGSRSPNHPLPEEIDRSDPGQTGYSGIRGPVSR